MPIELKSYCVHCGGPMEFPSELEGERIVCPHCHQLTYLGPRAEPPPTGRADLSVRQGSVETRGRDIARAFKGLAFVGFLISVPGCCYAGTEGGGGLGAWMVVFFASLALFIMGRLLE